MLISVPIFSEIQKLRYMSQAQRKPNKPNKESIIKGKKVPDKTKETTLLIQKQLVFNHDLFRL